MMATGAKADVVEVGYFGAGQFIPCDELSAGMVGYFTASLKNVKDTRVGDTVTDAQRPCEAPLPGYKKVNPMVYCGMYPADGAKYPDLRDALEKLQLNDAALQFEAETSIALGFGFRCGFLGLLHLEIIQERLEREYNLDLVTTAPSVIYKVHKTEDVYKRQGVDYLLTEDYVALRIIELCEKHKISRYRLSQLTGMSQTALGKIVSKESIPTIPTIEKICDAFGITLAQFFTKDGIRPDLSAGQLELVETWEYLDDKEREILLTFVRSLQKK